MKKLLIICFVSVFSGVVNASYMYWQIDPADVTSSGISGGAYAKIVASESSTYSETGTVALNSQYTYFDAESGLMQSSTPSGQTAAEYWSYDNYADLSTAYGDSYTYFVEIYNSSNQLVGHSEGVSYADIGLVSELGDVSVGEMPSSFHGVA